MTETNRHPIDRMADIKGEQAALEAEYAVLREGVIAGDIEPVGTQWLATIIERDHRTIIIAEAERLLPAEAFAALVHVNHQTAVTLHSITRPARPTAKRRPPRFARRGLARKTR